MSHATILRSLSTVMLPALVAVMASAQTVQLSIPDTTAKKGDTLLIPIRVASLATSDSVYSGQLTFSYDAGVINVLGVHTAGTITDSPVNILYNTTTRQLAFASASILTGSGVLVYLRTYVLENPTRDTTTIFFPQTAFNEGRPSLQLTAGKFRILSIRVSPKSPPSTLVVGDSLQFSVSGDQILPLTWTSSDTTVGKVDANGKFRAVAAGQAKVLVHDFRGLEDSTNLFPVYPAEARSLTVSIHDTSHRQTLLFNLPIYVSDVTSLGVISAQLRLNFQSSHLQAIDVIAATSMTAGWSSPSFNITSGQIEIALAGAQPLTGSGVLVYVRLRVLSNATGTSTVSSSNVLFNENLNANTVGGQFTALTAPTIVISPNSAFLARSDTLQFTVSSGGTPPYQWSPSNPAVASINSSTGLLTALARGTTTVTAVDYFGFAGTSGTIQVNDVRVRLPDTAVWVGDSVDVPMTVDDLTGLGIYSFEGRVKYNSNVVRSLSVINTGTLSGTFSISYKDTLDTLRIAAAGTSPLTGSGTLLKLRFKPAPSASPGLSSSLSFTLVQFNEPGPNTPTATTRNGSLSIVESAAVPVLTSPADGATGVSTSPMLVWNPSAGATSYGVQVSTVANFSTLLVNQIGITTTSLGLSGLSNNATYFWRVNASNSGGTSSYSAAFQFATIFTAPAVPTLVVPADGATGVSTGPTLRWNRSTGASTYRLQLSTVSDFLTTVLDSSDIIDTSHVVGGLSNNTVYFWHVSATNAAGTSSYSTGFEFTTIVAAPAAPVLALPGDGATGVSTSPTLRWNRSTGASSYRAQFSTVSDFSTMVLDSSNITDTSLVVASLSNNTTYFWRVNATNGGGTSSFSGGRSFTTIIVAPVAPVLTLPADGATGVSTTPTLSWNRSTGASTYRTQLSTVSDFSTTVLDSSNITDTLLVIGGLSNNTNYFWRVSAANAGGTSAFSGSRGFTTIIAAPAAPVLALPADGATGVSTSPILGWNSSIGASSYRTQLSTVSDFSTTVLDSSNIPDTSLVVGGLSNNTVYSWRVSAANAGGASSYSTVFQFTTIVAAPAAPVLALPADGATGVSTNPTVIWKSSAGAFSYRVQLSTVSDFSGTVLDSSGITDTSLVVGGLSNNTAYFWRATASNLGGSSLFSGSRSFTTIIAGPAAPVLALPADGATGVSTSPTLGWNSSTGASSYRAQLSTVSDFSTTVLDSSNITDTLLAVGGLSNNTVYFWRVNAANAGGTSAFSSSRSFTTIIAAPAVPLLALPADGATDVPKDATLQWTRPASATSFRVQISSDLAFTSVVVDSSGVTDTTLTVIGLSSDAMYFWRVSASNAGGTSSFSSTWSFRTTLPTSAELSLQNIPKEYQLAQNYPNPFNPSTSIRFAIPVESFVRLIAYDIMGNEIGTILAEPRNAGTYVVTFNAANLASGVYFYKLEAVPKEQGRKPFVRALKMILLK